MVRRRTMPGKKPPENSNRCTKAATKPATDYIAKKQQQQQEKLQQQYVATGDVPAKSTIKAAIKPAAHSLVISAEAIVTAATAASVAIATTIIAARVR